MWSHIHGRARQNKADRLMTTVTPIVEAPSNLHGVRPFAAATHPSRLEETRHLRTLA
ncbi:hypothetical protein RRSWK_04990 [Rhodopirellula sp. SWK7]|nr:hypothetical protein RRSWK_04990 [Rhodopirellula sp. SWK7]